LQDGVVFVCYGIYFDLFYDFSIALWWKCSNGWYLFVRVSILKFSTIFPLDCAGNVQTGWYLFAKVSILTFSTIFLMDCGGNVQTGSPQSNRKIAEKSKIDTLTNKYHPV
jgi:hypothetical protein